MPGANTRSVSARFCDNNWEKEKYFVRTFLHVVPVMKGQLNKTIRKAKIKSDECSL